MVYSIGTESYRHTPRRFLLANAQVFQRLDTLEFKQIHTGQKFESNLV
jgi:hypothetical protein